MGAGLRALPKSARKVKAEPKHFLWVTGLRPEKASRYRELHTSPWPGVLRMLKECHVEKFTIFEKAIESKIYLFAYVEYTGDDFGADMARIATDPETQRWWAETDPCQEPLPDAQAQGRIWSETTEIFRLPVSTEKPAE